VNLQWEEQLKASEVFSTKLDCTTCPTNCSEKFMFPLSCTATGAKAVDLKRESVFLQTLKDWGGTRNQQHACQHRKGEMTAELCLSVK